MKDRNRPIKYVIMGFFILLSCVLCELICNIGVLCLDKNERGTFDIDSSFYAMDGFEKDEDEYLLNGEKGSIT